MFCFPFKAMASAAGNIRGCLLSFTPKPEGEPVFQDLQWKLRCLSASHGCLLCNTEEDAQPTRGLCKGALVDRSPRRHAPAARKLPAAPFNAGRGRAEAALFLLQQTQQVTSLATFFCGTRQACGSEVLTGKQGNARRLHRLQTSEMQSSNVYLERTAQRGLLSSLAN